jgi:flagellar protein FlaG
MEIGRIDPMVGIATVSTLPSPLTPEQRSEQQRLVRAVEAVNQARLMGETSELTFAFDRESGKPVLRIVDRETKEVIRQIPPEYLLRLADDLAENGRGSASGVNRWS